jgi:hypothetical protein
VAFHICVTVWPFAKLQRRVQPATAAVPVLRIVTSAPNPPDHWLATL